MSTSVNDSWQFAPRLVAKRLEGLKSFAAFVITEDPRGVFADLEILTLLGLLTRRPEDSTFLVGDVLDGLTEEVLLLFAVLAPEGSVHDGLLFGEAFREAVVFGRSGRVEGRLWCKYEYAKQNERRDRLLKASAAY
jgi:hypothetical protein